MSRVRITSNFFSSLLLMVYFLVDRFFFLVIHSVELCVVFDHNCRWLERESIFLRTNCW